MPLLKKGVFAILAVLLVSYSALLAQEKRPGRLFAGADGPILIDGALDDPAWTRAPEANGLLRMFGQGLEPGQVSTSVKILYDADNLYIGFACIDPHPEMIITRGYEPGADIRNDDSVYVLIDAQRGDDLFNVFGTNSRRILFEALASKDGQFFERGRKNDWQAGAKKTPTGWTAELAIPLKALNPQKTLPSLKVMFSRIVPRYSRSFWNGPLDPAFDLTLPGEFGSLDLALGASRTSVSLHTLGLKQPGGKFYGQAGLEAQYEFSPDLIAAATVFPDMITVEDDDEIVNLTRFELRYPERRGYFQDPAGLHSLQIPIFYSKRIGDIYGGLKFEGTVAGIQFQAMSNQTQKETISGPDSYNFSVVRLKKDSGPFSLGATVVNKYGDGLNVGAASLDGSWSVTKAWRIEGQAAQSYGQSKSGTSAFYFGTRYDVDRLHVRAAYTHLGDNFGDNVNEFGYIPDDNRRQVEGDLELSFPVRLGKLDRVRVSTANEAYWGMDQTLRGWQTDETLSLDFGRTSTLSLSHMEEYVLFEEGFRNFWTRVMIDWNPSDPWKVSSAAYYMGRIFGGGFQMLELTKGLVFTPEVRALLRIQRFDYDLDAAKNPNNHNATGWAIGLRFFADMSRNLTSSVIIHIASKDSRFEDIVGPKKHWSLTVVRSYYQLMAQVKVLPPFGLIQIGYQKTDYEYDLPSRIRNGLFLKFTALF